jgi:chemotaxis signal transduction protein
MAGTLFGIDVSMHNIINSNALLLYKVGPVLVCSPTLPVESITIPPNLNSLPGANEAEPGMFKSMHGMVRVVDLRVRFGVDAADRKSPGRIIISEATGGYVGFWVDEIEDVISFPEKGWSQLPAHVPREAFSRALIRDEGIRLYADLENLDNFKATGYLRDHIENIKLAEVRVGKRDSDSLVAKNTVQVKTENVPLHEGSNREVSDSKNIASAYNPSSVVSPASGGVKNVSNNIKEKKSGVINNSLNGEKAPRKALDKEVIKKSVSEVEKENISFDPVARAVKSVADQQNKNFEIKSVRDSEYVSPAKNKEKILAEEEPRNDILWLSVLVLSFISVSVYVVEFSGDFSDDVSISSNVNNKKTQPDNNDSAVINNYKDDDSNEIKVLSDYSNDTVDISKTDEGIVIVINDYEEEISVDYSEIEKPSNGEVKLKEDNYIKDAVEQGDAPAGVEGNGVDAVDLNKSIKVDTNVERMTENTVTNRVYQNAFNREESSDLLEVDVSVTPVKSKEPTESKVIKTLKSVHIVIAGDTLWHIAKRYVNNPWRYPELARLSKIEDPDLIYPGQKVIIIYNTNK